MQIVIQDIAMPVRHTKEDVLRAAQEIVRLHCVRAENFQIYRQSLDARRKQNIHYVYSVSAETLDLPASCGKQIQPMQNGANLDIPTSRHLPYRPVIVGMGPCGLFAAYILMLSGNPPIILERGEDVDRRTQTVQDFWNTGKLNLQSNVQFGEGGAGTFSDGKLTTRISDPRQRYVLETFAAHGGPEDILYKAKPHIGTDCLKAVVRSMREELIRQGAEVQFNSCLTGIKTKSGKISEIEINHSISMPCKKLILAIGHSSRDTYQILADMGIPMVPKAFAAGVRVEHPQSFINHLQYGSAAENLPPADYRLAYNGKERSCYSFCMCPGGQVVNASSEQGCLVVNGMSRYQRDGRNANSALVVTVRPEDFDGADPMAGIAFQRRYERLAFEIGGGDGCAPVQLAVDFMNDRPSSALRETNPDFAGSWRFAELKKCLPLFITQTLREGLHDFDRKLRDFSKKGVLTGVEMRTSAPVRILRSQMLESIGVEGLYPAGEGAGYAGGIVSAAVDGIRVAQMLLEQDGME
ncbi:NAD(P)/FAD-dependent oxidoreductase [Ructibacterium gallinarum]|uniref:NAD(P)/FAD-dependent oxidoreductase n=1 Tax=Ructibacterium gallinarum TaxID=2779355 RepID=A0A9D5M181_9FIRM|nr:NAD(P)/FAD-dependent oxidoreductase [Ructibacterium gallinarum]MBE5040410.1 NAD(P)/FAD-dependent oxidoreductase [Ructibacterium gallinarum]